MLGNDSLAQFLKDRKKRFNYGLYGGIVG